MINGGSSSFKCALYDTLAPVWSENVRWTGATPPAEVLKSLFARAGAVDVVGHRIVHGGRDHRATTWITAEVRATIAAQAEVAPAHNRFELAAIDAAREALGSGVRQAAVFDTAFHATLAHAAYVYPGPYEWLEKEGIRRYGFHGLSFQYSTRRAAELLGQTPHRLLICHLGSGASLCAVRDGRSVDTTMGFTPLEGLMMGSRSGSFDPGIIVYLLRHRGYTAEQLDEILNRESGLLGISGVSSDIREVLKQADQGDARARLALDIYIHRLTREAGSMIAVLGGLDALVFTGGVGENCAPVRDALCAQLGFLGSNLRVLVIHADEESEVARECHQLIKAADEHR